jgi:hypothetical protein
MTLILSGTDGLSDIDGTASTPAIRGTDANTGIFFPAADVVATATNGTEKSRTDSSGNYLLGTTSWSYSGNRGIQNRASGSDNSSIFLETDSATIKGFMASDPTASRVGLGSLSNHPLVFIANDAERARIDSSGSLIVGTTAATGNAEKLNVSRSGSSLRVVHFENLRNLSGDENLRIALGSNCNNTSSYSLICTTGGTDRLYIYGNGNVVNSNNSYGSLSDVAIKENIVDATPKLADIMQVRVRNYNLKDDENKTKQIGVVAQELEEIFPSMIETDGISGHKQVKYSVFVPMLLKAIQEQQTMIQELKAKVAALEAKG